VEFIEAPFFTRILANYLNDEEYGRLQQHLVKDPAAGDTIQETGGFRKVRWPDAKRGQGKRGGLRVIYYYFEEDRQIWLLTIYAKHEAADLTPSEKRALKAAITEEKRQRLKRREAKRSNRR
jgi:hypothetical protein